MTATTNATLGNVEGPTSTTPAAQITLRWVDVGGVTVELAGQVRRISADRQFTIELTDPPPRLPPIGWAIELDLAGTQAGRCFRGRRSVTAESNTIVVQLEQPPRGALGRRYTRAQVDLPALIFSLDARGQSVDHSPARLVDLGAGGVRFACLRALPIGTRIRLGFLPGGPPPISPSVDIIACDSELLALAETQWTHVARGRFVGISEDERHRVFQHVRHLI